MSSRALGVMSCCWSVKRFVKKKKKKVKRKTTLPEQIAPAWSPYGGDDMI